MDAQVTATNVKVLALHGPWVKPMVIHKAGVSTQLQNSQGCTKRKPLLLPSPEEACLHPSLSGLAMVKYNLKLQQVCFLLHCALVRQ